MKSMFWIFLCFVFSKEHHSLDLATNSPGKMTFCLYHSVINVIFSTVIVHERNNKNLWLLIKKKNRIRTVELLMCVTCLFSNCLRYHKLLSFLWENVWELIKYFCKLIGWSKFLSFGPQLHHPEIWLFCETFSLKKNRKEKNTACCKRQQNKDTNYKLDLTKVQF